MDDRLHRSRAPGGFSPQAAAALIEQVPAGFRALGGVIDFTEAPFSQVTYAYPSRPAARVSLDGLPEPMRQELLWWLCSLHAGGERVNSWTLQLVGQGRRGARRPTRSGRSTRSSACRSRNGCTPRGDSSMSATAGCRAERSSRPIERRSRACAPRLCARMARASGGGRMCGSRGAIGGSRCASTSRWGTRGCASPRSSSRGCGRRSSGSSPRRWSAACWRGRRCPATAPTWAATSPSSCLRPGSTIRAWPTARRSCAAWRSRSSRICVAASRTRRRAAVAGQRRTFPERGLVVLPVHGRPSARGGQGAGRAALVRALRRPRAPVAGGRVRPPRPARRPD